MGVRLGRGETLEQIKETSDEIAEGVATTPAAAALARKLGHETAIILAVEALLKGGNARELVAQLLQRPPSEEDAVFRLQAQPEKEKEKEKESEQSVGRGAGAESKD